MYRFLLRIMLIAWLSFSLLITLSILAGKSLNSPVLSFIAKDETTDIFLHDIRTGLSHNLTNTVQPEWHMSWAQDQAYLSYTTTINLGEAGDNVYVMTRLGSPLNIEISENRSALGTIIAPNGSKVAYFSSYPRTFSDIYVTDLEDKITSNLTQTAEESEIVPHWSPNSRDLLYLRDGNLYRADTLTLDIELFLDYEMLIELAAWSPDGEHIAFLSNRRDTQGTMLQLHRISVDGTDLRIYQLNAEPRSEVLSWSPDSCCVVLGLMTGELAIVELETGDVTYYVGEERRFAPVWSSDGHWIAFIENRLIHILNLQSNEAYQLGNHQRVRTPMYWMP